MGFQPLRRAVTDKWTIVGHGRNEQKDGEKADGKGKIIPECFDVL